MSDLIDARLRLKALDNSPGFQNITAPTSNNHQDGSWQPTDVYTYEATIIGDSQANVKMQVRLFNDEIVTFDPSGGGAVDSVNGQIGVVVLDPDDLDDSLTTNKFVDQATLNAIALNIAARHNQNTDTGTNSDTFAIDNDGVNIIVKAVADKIQVRNGADSDDRDLQTRELFETDIKVHSDTVSGAVTLDITGKKDIRLSLTGDITSFNITGTPANNVRIDLAITPDTNNRTFALGPDYDPSGSTTYNQGDKVVLDSVDNTNDHILYACNDNGVSGALDRTKWDVDTIVNNGIKPIIEPRIESGNPIKDGTTHFQIQYINGVKPYYQLLYNPNR